MWLCACSTRLLWLIFSQCIWMFSRCLFFSYFISVQLKSHEMAIAFKGILIFYKSITVLSLHSVIVYMILWYLILIGQSRHSGKIFLNDVHCPWLHCIINNLILYKLNNKYFIIDLASSLAEVEKCHYCKITTSLDHLGWVFIIPLLVCFSLHGENVLWIAGHINSQNYVFFLLGTSLKQ